MDLGSRRAWLATVVLVLPALAWLALEGRVYPPAERFPTGDYAKIELYTRLATEGSQRLGPESRFHVHHPGPSFFYAAAPIYALAGGTTKGMAVAALVWNLMFLVALFRSADRVAPGTGPLIAALVLAALLQARGVDFLLSSFNPHVAMIPFGVALLASARLATGDGRALPVLAVAASVVVQNQMAWSLALGLTAAVGLALCLWPTARRVLRVPTTGRGLTRGAVTAAVLASALLWALPVIDELTGDYRNFRRILTLGSGSALPRPWRETLEVSARALNPWRDGVASVEGTLIARGLAARDAAAVAVTLSALGLAGWLAARRRSATAALALVATVGVVSVPLTARSLPGHVLPLYLFQWAEMVTLTALLAFGIEALARCARLRALALGPGGTALLLSLPILLLASSVRATQLAGPVARDARAVEVERLTREVKSRAGVEKGRRFLVRVAPHADQATVMGLILALDKAGLRFAVEPFGSCRLEGHFRPRGNEWAELRVGDLPPPRDAVSLGSPEGLRVVWQVWLRSGAPVPTR